MTEFQYPDDCTYCQSRIGSTHCLLPYQLVKQYSPPEDKLSLVIDVTEIHAQYGFQILKNNYDMIEWIKNRNNSNDVSAQSEVSRSVSKDWYEQMTESVDSDSHQLKLLALKSHDCDVQSTYSDWITSQLRPDGADGVSISCSDDESRILFEGREKKSKDFQTDPIVSELASVRSQVDQLEGLSSSLEVEDHVKSLSLNRDQKNHIIQDLLVSAKAAFNIYSKQRGGIRTTALKESLMSEQDIRLMTGMRYSPSFNTTLDGNKALAKEIIARHSHDQIQTWESGGANHEIKDCILNKSAFRPPIDANLHSKLGEELIIYFSTIMKIYDTKKDCDFDLAKIIKFELSKSDYPTTFDWIKNRSKYIGMKYHPKQLAMPNQKSQVVSQETKTSNPTIDQRLADYINVHLQVIINRELMNAGTNVPMMTDETKVEKFIFKLASEFLTRNKGWHNENSFTDPSHLQKIEESTGLKSRPSESYLTFTILKAVLDKFRIAFKEKHPKAGKPF